MSQRIFMFVLGMVILGTSFAYADDALREKTYALQNRKYLLKNEFFAAAAWLPLDAYEKGVALNASYTHYFNQFMGIELPQLLLIQNYSTGLQEDLIRLFGVEDTNRNSNRFALTGNLVFRPAYRKSLLFNRNIVHGETFFIVGGGLFFFEDGFEPTLDVALGHRLYLSKTFSFRTEIRDYITFDALDLGNQLMVSAGFSMQLGTGK